MKIVLATTFLSLAFTTVFSQHTWQKGGNNAAPPGFPPTLGANWPSPLIIRTNSTNRAQFTTNTALSSITGDNGDGLRIIDPDGGTNGGVGNLDLFCSNNNGGDETHIVFGPNGQISGQASRFELYGKLNGFK